MKTAFVLVAVLCMPAFAFSATIYVPDDYAKIQQAIDAAVDGDTIIVRPGTYVENINFVGKAITVQSEEGPQATKIDGGGAGCVVRFINHETRHSILEGFAITNGYSAYGGGIQCHVSSPTIIDNHIRENTSDNGGGIYCIGKVSPLIRGNSLIKNLASDGGGITCFIGTGSEGAEIIDNLISKNTALNKGGGIYAKGLSVIENNWISHNHAEFGSGIHGAGMSESIITGNFIEHNEAAQEGGGLYFEYQYGHNPLVTLNIIRMNIGSGILCGENSVPIILKNVIEKNEGRGIHLLSSMADIKSNMIRANKYGGVACIGTMNYTVVFANNFIVGNHTPSQGGGLLITGSALLINNTVAGNTAALEGGGIFCADSQCKIFNTILWGNEASAGQEAWLDADSSFKIDYSDVEGGLSNVHAEPGSTLEWGSNMIDADPLFILPLLWDYHILYPSPCRNKGDNKAQGMAYLEDDFESDPRIFEGIVDMGADEFHPHFYCTGHFRPGGTFNLNFIGLPESSPVGLFYGSGVLDRPIYTNWGPFYLTSPWDLIFPLGTISSEGLLAIPIQLPVTPPAPYDLPMQALIGLNPDSLTNLYVLEVR
ncbi:MAG: right-handed parallel beta-helix repeat-containing protein [Planctomycetota bacterium]